MKKLFYIKDSNENRISYYHLLAFLLALPFDRFYSTLALISLLIHSTIFFNRSHIKNINYTIFILQSVFFVTLLSTCYSLNFSLGLETTTRQLAILLFPLIFAVTSLNIARYRSTLLLGFSLGCTFTIVYLFADAIRIISYYHLPAKSIFSPAFINHNFSLPIEIHATYLSMMLVISMIYFLRQLFTYQTSINKSIYIISLAILFAGLVQLGSKSVLIALLIIINIGLPLFVMNNQKTRRFLIISVSVTTLLLALILSVDAFRTRYVNLLEDDLGKKSGIMDHSSRFERWKIAVSLIKQSPFTGTGSGSEIPLLKEEYFERKMFRDYLNSLNAHNQYLSFLINSGIWGLMVYLGTLYWGFRRSVKTRDILLFGFMVLISVVSLSENILDVNKGIFFYAFFFCLFTSGKKKATTLIKWDGRQPKMQNNVLIK